MPKSRAEDRTANDDVVVRARKRCAQHLGLPRAFCTACFRIELEAQLAAENPTLDPEDVAGIVDDWILASDKPLH